MNLPRGEVDDGGLGASLVAMSISPGAKGATISESLGSRVIVTKVSTRRECTIFSKLF